MDFVPAVGAQEQPAAVVQPGEGALDDPALSAESGAVPALSPGDYGLHAPLADESPVLVMVVADQRASTVAATRSADATAHRRYTVVKSVIARDQSSSPAACNSGSLHSVRGSKRGSHKP